MSGRQWPAVFVLVLCVAVGRIDSAAAQTGDLTRLSLVDLLNVEVTSVSRKQQTLSRTAAAVHVITQEDIRRSGARTIPDLLRMVPGFTVAQVDAASWAVTSRGFNGVYANKLLVLVDGRSVYNLLFAGVYWEMQSLPLVDIERIEVVRGPGGSLWGANAVNGIVNIITKSADQTQGGVVTAAGGGVQNRAGEVRYGGGLGDRTHYRVYGKYAERGTNQAVAGFDDADDADVTLGGGRIDWNGDAARLSVHGAIQDGASAHDRSHTLLSAPWKTLVEQSTAFSEGHLVVSWTRSPSSRQETSLQAAYQSYTRHQEIGAVSTFGERWRTADVEVRQKQALGRWHELVGGAGYRFSSSATDNAYNVAFLPASERRHLLTAFLQDEIELPAAVRLTPGGKVEYSNLTGAEFQPSLRVTWSPGRSNATWAALSRSVRTPSRSDRGINVPTAASPGPGGALLVVMLEGNPDVTSETLQAYEVGHRVQFGRGSVDATVFRNEYGGLISARAGARRPGTFADRAVQIVPLRMENMLDGHTYGAEATAAWRVLEWWRVGLSASLLRYEEHDPLGNAAAVRKPNVPEHQLSFHSYLDLPRNIEASAFVYRIGAADSSTAAYTSANARVAWRTRGSLELAFGAENLFHSDAPEFVDTTGFQSSPVRTAVTAEVSWKF